MKTSKPAPNRSATPSQFTAWSFSRLRMYEECPAKAKFKFLDKHEDTGSKAMDRGSEVHKDCEAYLKGELRQLPAYLKEWAEEFSYLRKVKAASELEMGFTKTWEHRADWFSRDVWCRVKVDALYADDKLVVVDFKTGRFYPDHEPVMRLYTLAAFKAAPMIFPKKKLPIQTRAELWYLDNGELLPLDITMNSATLKTFEKEWETRTKAMMSDKKFAPRPSNRCPSCPFSKAKGGPCAY